MQAQFSTPTLSIPPIGCWVYGSNFTPYSLTSVKTAKSGAIKLTLAGLSKPVQLSAIKGWTKIDPATLTGQSCPIEQTEGLLSTEEIDTCVAMLKEILLSQCASEIDIHFSALSPEQKAQLWGVLPDRLKRDIHELKNRPVPDVGDKALVLAGPYNEYLSHQIHELSKSDEWDDRKRVKAIRAEIDNFGWMTIVFRVRSIQGDMATIQGGGMRRQMPVKCLVCANELEDQKVASA